MAKSVTGMLVAVAAVLVVPLISYSAGLGKLTVRSALGQPLDAEIEVVSLRPGEDDSFQVRLATREAFREAGIDFSPALESARFAVERRDGRPVIRLTTTQPMNDPFLSVLVEMQWPTGRLARQYTFLVDPIEYKTSALVAAPTSATAPASAPAPAQPVAAVPAATPAPAQPVAAAPAAAAAPSQSVAVAPAAVAAPVPVAPAAAAPASAQPAAAPAQVPAQPAVSAPATASVQTPTIQASPATAPVPHVVAVRVPAQALAPQPVDPADRVVQSYRIRRGDTLGAIARKWKPEGVTLNQMLVAFYQGNPGVFIRNNINLIRAGATLSIPYREEVAAIEPSKAFRQVRLQMSEFARYRRQQGTAVSAAPVRPVQREVVSGGRAGGRKAARSL